MCSAGAGVALQVLGLGAGIAGTQMQVRANQQAAEYQRIVANNNRIVAEYQAKDAEQRGELEKQELGKTVSRIRGQGRTGFAAGNVALASGSVLDWEQDVATESTIERLKIDRNTEMEAWALRNQDFDSQANLAQAQAGASAAAGRISTVGSILSTASQFAASNVFSRSRSSSAPSGWSKVTPVTKAAQTVRGTLGK